VKKTGTQIHKDKKIHQPRAAECSQDAVSYPGIKACAYQTAEVCCSTVLMILLFSLGFLSSAYPQDIKEVIRDLQRRYASVNTVTADFQQDYRAPGIHQTESGKLWLKKPGLMRWEYDRPEKKLYVTDGEEAFSYVPEERQVTVQPFTAAEMHRTPLQFLLGGGDLERDFVASWASELSTKDSDIILIRLTPHRNNPEYAFLVLGLDQKTYDIQRIVIHEPSGNISEFLFTNQVYNAEIGNEKFKFRIPDGVEVMRLEDSE
jgi:outer membrane lipoprotein carrier protein